MHFVAIKILPLASIVAPEGLPLHQPTAPDTDILADRQGEGVYCKAGIFGFCPGTEQGQQFQQPVVKGMNAPVELSATELVSDVVDAFHGPLSLLRVGTVVQTGNDEDKQDFSIGESRWFTTGR